MKKLLLAAVCFGSSIVNASESENIVSGINVVKVERSASVMQVKSVEIKTSNLGRGLGFNVFAVVEFGNSCMVPKPSEVVMSFLMGQGFDDVSYSLISLNTDRACPAVYRPVVVTYDLGSITHPLDASYQSIKVNGVEGVK